MKGFTNLGSFKNLKSKILSFKSVLILISWIGCGQIFLSSAKVWVPTPTANSTAGSWINEAQEKLNKGQFSRCIKLLEPLLRIPTVEKGDYYRALLIRGAAHQYLGSFQSAFADLKEANRVAENLDPLQQITAMMRIGDSLFVRWPG